MCWFTRRLRPPPYYLPGLARILLLGSTGFLGAAVAPALLQSGNEVHMLVRDPAMAGKLRAMGAVPVQGDILDHTSLVHACSGAETVVNLVAVRRNRPQSYLAVNADGPRILADAARKTGTVRHIIHISAIGARQDPTYRYLTSRWMGEEEMRRSGAPLTILRFSLILGEEGGVFHDFQRAAKFGPVMVIPGSGAARFQPIVREDAAACIAAAVGRKDLVGHEINLGGPEILSYNQLFELFCSTQGITKSRIHVPAALLSPGAAVMEAILTDPIATPDEIRTIQLDNLADGLDVVPTHFEIRAQSPTTWIPEHWKPPPAPPVPAAPARS